MQPGPSGGAWSDRLLSNLEAMRWPLWSTLVVATAGGIVVVHLVEWMAGDLPFGRFDAFRSTFPLYPFGILGLIAVQKQVSLQALERFRPTSGFDDEAYARAARSLTMRPPRLTLIMTVAFGLVGLVIETTREGAEARALAFPVAYYFDLVLGFLGYMMAGPWVVGVVRLLSNVARLHRDAPHVDLLNPEPVRALSSATAVVGVSLIAITTLSFATDPETHGTLTGLSLSILLVGLGFASFVTPLWGMHRRLLAERARMLSEVGRRIQSTMLRLYDHVDEDRSGVAELRDRMSALVAARDLVAHQSTWPWRPETLRWLLSALVVPIVLWAVTRFLEGTLQSIR
jgi:hypothetical protein